MKKEQINNLKEMIKESEHWYWNGTIYEDKFLGQKIYHF